MVGEIVLFVYLLVMAAWDMVKGKISLRFSVATAGVLLGLRVWEIWRGEVSWEVAFSGVMVGGCLLALAKLSRQAVGVGDGIVFIITGLLLGLWENFVLLFLSLSLVGIVGGILLMIRRVRRKTLIPFVPFVLIGYGVMFIWEIMELT